MSSYGLIKYKIDDELIKDTLQQALTSTGKEKISNYKKLRFFKLHKGMWLIKMVSHDE